MKSTVIVVLLSVPLLCGALRAARAQVEPQPAFAGQTDAPAPRKPSVFTVQTVTTRLSGPWSLQFLPDGRMLVSERNGTLRIVRPDGVVSAPIAGVPGVKVVAAQSFHDLLLDPDFGTNRRLYFTYFAPPHGEAPAMWPNEFFYDRVFALTVAERRALNLGMETVARARLSADDSRLEDVEVIAEGAERRLVLANDGTLFVTGADRFRFYEADLDGLEREIVEQDVLRNYSGRVLRINRDGSIPKDNPWLGRPTVAPATFSYGHRDPEGAAIHPDTGELWMVEHGPMGGDELNIVRAGRNYGWPNVSYGLQYDGKPVGAGRRSADDVEQPIYFWVPSIAPSGMSFYTGTLFPDWRGDLFIGALAGQHLIHLVLDGERVIAEEQLLGDAGQRIRDVRQGPDGALYLLTDAGQLLRLVPR